MSEASRPAIELALDVFLPLHHRKLIAAGLLKE